MKKQIKAHRPIYPTPAGLVTSCDADGKPNIITLGEVFNLSISSPVVVGLAIAPQRYSHQLIRQSGEFVVNLPTAAIFEKVVQCGSASGRDIDKFEAFGLTPMPAQKVRPPLIAECPVNLECLVVGFKSCGDHDLFEGRVLVQHVDEGMLNADGSIAVEKLDGFAFVLGQFWSFGRLLWGR